MLLSVLAALTLAMFANPGAALAHDAAGSTSENESDSPELSREAWRQRVEQAKRRSQEVARERREHPELYTPVPEDPEVIATERILNDESLQNGMFVYRGRPGQPRREQDFVPLRTR